MLAMARYGIQVVDVGCGRHYVIAELPDGEFRKGPMSEAEASMLARSMRADLEQLALTNKGPRPGVSGGAKRAATIIFVGLFVIGMAAAWLVR